MNGFYQSLPLIAVVLLLIFCTILSPLQDNQPWRRIGSIALGVIFIVWGATSIFKGHITAWRRATHTYFIDHDPVGFWVVVSFVIVLGLSCVIRGIRGRR